MRLPTTLLLLLFSFLSTATASPQKRHYKTHNYYVLEHDPLSNPTLSLDDIFDALGVELVEQAGELENHWLVRVDKSRIALEARQEPSDDRILERFENFRTKARDSHLLPRSTAVEQARAIASSVKHLSRQELRQRVKRAPAPPPPSSNPPVANETLSHTVATQMGITDPLFEKQWHLVNDDFREHMMNVTGLWKMNITGKGVISSMVDDGLDYESEDLKANFDASGSYDFNDHQDLPTPKLYDDHHGTRCAGQVAAVRNDKCGVGIAYNSKVAGVRILSGPISDVDEAAALNYGFQTSQIYSCSWGPPDDGRSMEGPNDLIKKAVLNGITNGRGGKGSVFVFASGNGAAHGDQCNFDGYTNSIYSVTVSAIDFKGEHPYYSEPCAANMIVAYSSGAGKHIVTTDRGKDACASTHGGTSAAAPNAVGVFALALEVRPDLTWRDMQHLCVETAREINKDDPDWEVTTNGRRYSYKYGFGALDGYSYVMAAKTWKLVKPQAWVEFPPIQVAGGTLAKLNEMKGGEFIGSGGVKSTMKISKKQLKKHNFEKLEHITVKVWINHARRGDVEVEVISPNKVKSVLGAKRVSDNDAQGYQGWTFMSVKHWGEDPVGTWTIRVSDQQNDNNGTFLGWAMSLWGSAIDGSKAKPYEFKPDDIALPPTGIPVTTTQSSSSSTISAPSSTSASATNTKTHPKPTAHLPGDHGTAEGEKDKPAFPSSTPTVDEGWFPGMANLVSGRKWFFGVVGVVTMFALAAALFFYRRNRQARRRRDAYNVLPGGDDVPLRTVGGLAPASRGTRELYDAFGEVSDDDEDEADEETGLTGRRDRRGSAEMAGYHDTPLGERMIGYRDEPEGDEESGRVEEEESHSGSGTNSTSGDGSWELAPETR